MRRYEQHEALFLFRNKKAVQIRINSERGAQRQILLKRKPSAKKFKEEGFNYGSSAKQINV